MPGIAKFCMDCGAKIPSSPKRTPIPAKMRFEVLKRDKNTCVYCGRKSPDIVLHVDHVVAVALGGTNSLSNLVAACEDCNRGKGATSLSDESLQVWEQGRIQREQAVKEERE